MYPNFIVLVFLAGVKILQFGVVTCDDISPKITIAQGTLVGHIYNTSYGSYYAFQGIPYAKSPVGNLRFKAPVPAEPWNGIYTAIQEGSQCLQAALIRRTEVKGEEDCLFINVYTSQLPDPNNLLPVMVWIHGGGFYEGSGNVKGQGPAFLLNYGVIYVSLNYRLGVLGFLSTEDGAAPGNAGMKDQTLALRWVKQNIAAFGGDPDKVTIFGASAGGAAVSLHVVSPLSAGLFRAAIPQSGSSTNPWSIREKNTGRETAFTLGKALGYTGNSSQELVDFLRMIDGNDLLQGAAASIPKADTYRLSSIVFVPVVEPDVEGEESFLNENPIQILADGKFNKISLLTGTSSAEGLFFLGQKSILNGRTPIEEIDQNFSKIFKPELRICKTEPCGDEMIAKIRSFYFGDDPITRENLDKLIDLVTDMFITEGTVYEIEMVLTFGSEIAYLYEFTYEGELGHLVNFGGVANFSGVSHADELLYLFDTGVEVAAGSKDAEMRKTLLEIWTNFVKTGNPTPDGETVESKFLRRAELDNYYLEINSELEVKADFKKERMDFWKELYSSS